LCVGGIGLPLFESFVFFSSVCVSLIVHGGYG
jgi:hypothetical protein